MTGVVRGTPSRRPIGSRRTLSGYLSPGQRLDPAYGSRRANLGGGPSDDRILSDRRLRRGHLGLGFGRLSGPGVGDPWHAARPHLPGRDVYPTRLPRHAVTRLRQTLPRPGLRWTALLLRHLTRHSLARHRPVWPDLRLRRPRRNGLPRPGLTRHALLHRLALLRWIRYGLLRGLARLRWIRHGFLRRLAQHHWTRHGLLSRLAQRRLFRYGLLRRLT